MSDFAQHGVITTLHNLRDRSIDDFEAELTRFSQTNPMALILPSLYSELQGPALPKIVSDLELVPYIDDIVVGLDRADEKQFEHAQAFFSHLPQRRRILWHDGPRMTALDQELKHLGLAPRLPGKGRNVWYCLGYLLSVDRAEAIALHDCDIVTYDRFMPARLFYPVANPSFDFRFCKGYYSRVSESALGGRVTRLFTSPLVAALKKILGPLDYLEYLDNFRYLLSGEFAMRKDEARGMRIPSDWGLEIGVLSEVYRNISRHHICQVDIADRYDHKHQELAVGDADAGLNRMTVEVSKSIFRKLATEGVTLYNELFRTIKATYFRIALDRVQQYHCDAVINGLQLDLNAETQAVELFAQSIMTAGEHFLQNPMEVPFSPNWMRVFDAIPDFSERLVEAVELDNA
ncbi:MAG TPA: glycosyl transferase [Gammaproteobacteria bacterium]|nr:glycosyl transferase [Gammaproteobacteria bacterium]